MAQSDLDLAIAGLVRDLNLKFAPPEFIPGCVVKDVTNINDYATDNGWIEAICGQHNQQRVRYKGWPAGVAVDDILDVVYYPSHKFFEVHGVGGATATSADKVKVTKLYESDLGAVAWQTNASGDLSAVGAYDLITTGDLDGANIIVADDIIHSGDADTLLSFTDDLVELQSGGVVMLRLTETAQNLVELGDVAGTGDVDVNINAGQVFVQGSDGNIGLGTNSPGTDRVAVQGPSGANLAMGFYTGDGDGTDFASLILYGVGTPGSIVNRERLIIQYNQPGPNFRIQSEADGTGTLRDIVIETEGNSNQLALDTGGSVGIGANPPAVGPSSVFGLHIKSPSSHAGIFVDGAAGSNAFYYMGDGGAAVWHFVYDGTTTQQYRIVETSVAVRLAIDVGTGAVGIGTVAQAAKLHVDQASTTAAIPVLYIDQADVDQPLIEFNTTIGVGNAIEAVGAKTLTVTHFGMIKIPGGLTRYFPIGTIA